MAIRLTARQHDCMKALWQLAKTDEFDTLGISDEGLHGERDASTGARAFFQAVLR